ncbi:hypothetical protein ASD01_23985 [Ensifer sp. Root423]|uniref:TetR/AcrR family transcriptional regulator n=1 Tax=Ensifer TaxID=106591 RepID=UPI000712F7CB|nr:MULTISPECIES: TetR/AcrR family transcriptional regulator [Ensifer]KQX26719.1 hypothetical protein ASD01_23985 [Ensifer sp. Root423]RAS10736.1 TetR family transcriptional regulator [Ensifer adhaerens]
MDKKALLTPRKVASQQRSRAMIEALVEATARALIKEGFERANTNRIAEEAGVSIGSLYQYFPGKEALVVAVIERHKSEMVDVLRGTLAKVATLPLDSAARELVKTMIDAHRVNPDLHRVLVEETPRAGRIGTIDGFDREFYGLIRAYLELHKAELRDARRGGRQSREAKRWERRRLHQRSDDAPASNCANYRGNMNRERSQRQLLERE